MKRSRFRRRENEALMLDYCWLFSANFWRLLGFFLFQNLGTLNGKFIFETTFHC